MSLDDDVNAVIEAIYAASASPHAWPTALRATTELFASAGATIEVFRKDTAEHRFYSGFGIPDASEVDYVEHYASINPRVSHGLSQRCGDIGYDDLVISRSDIASNEFYDAFLTTCGLKYFVSGCLIQTPELFGIVAVQRTPRQGHVDAPDLVLMNRLLPHFRQALDLSLRWQKVEQAKAGTDEALDRLRDGVVILDETGAAVHLNRMAEAILGDRDGVSLANGRLAVAQGEAMLACELALEGALRGSDREAAAPFEIAVARPSGKTPYVVALRPYRDADGRRGALVFIHDPSASGAAARKLMRQAFGLTEAEAQLAHGLVNGLSLRQYAGQKGLSINTIYTHYHRLKDKTDSGGQAALMANLKNIAMALD